MRISLDRANGKSVDGCFSIRRTKKANLATAHRYKASKTPH
jgi:hypothetical protein